MPGRKKRKPPLTQDLASEEAALKKLEQPVVRLLSCDQVFRAWAGHRYEILTVLGLQGRLTVTEITERLHLKMSQVSRDLHRLAGVGLVEWVQDKNTHWFRLTPTFVAHVNEGRVQFWLGLPNGDWLGMHREEYSASKLLVSPPTCFLVPPAPADASPAGKPHCQHDHDISTDPEVCSVQKPGRAKPSAKVRPPSDNGRGRKPA